MLQLTTPIDVGALDTNDYTHVKVVNLLWDGDNGRIRFATEEGYVVDSVFVKGTHSIRRSWEVYDRPQIGKDKDPNYVAAAPQYTTLVAVEVGKAAEALIYDRVEEELINWLTTVTNHEGGTVPYVGSRV